MKKHRTLILLMIIGAALTVAAREYAVARRISMGLTPSWGGEIFIIPIILIAYFTVKADWSFE